jgi:hypothetical protein
MSMSALTYWVAAFLLVCYGLPIVLILALVAITAIVLIRPAKPRAVPLVSDD